MLRIFLALLLVLPTSVLAADAADAAARLAGLLAGARSMEATFRQTVSGANGVVSQQSQGRMTVSRPQLFRWDIRTPFEQLIIADGKQVWVYDPDLAQAVVRPFSQQLSETPALLFSGDARKIGETFTVRLLDEKGGLVRFELLPKNSEALFESLRVGFQAGRLLDMVLVDGLGQRTTISFSDVVLNPAVPPARFQFTPPAGTDVIRETD